VSIINIPAGTSDGVSIAPGALPDTLTDQANPPVPRSEICWPCCRSTGDETWSSSKSFQSDRYEEVSLANWLAHLPPKLVSAHLNIPEETLATFPRNAQGIVPLP
jgi:hypothetical protein